MNKGNEQVELGIFGGIANEDYHKMPGLSSSGLKNLERSPAHYIASKLKPYKREVIGTLTHLRTLERDKFESTVIQIAGHRGSKSVKEEVELAEAAGKFPVKPEEYEKVCRMSDAVLNHPTAKRLLNSGIAEHSVFWKDSDTQVLLKCRPDYLRANEGIVLDLKYFNDLRDSEIERQIHRMRYHWQSAFYLAGVTQAVGQKLNMFAHIFVEEPEFPDAHIGVRVAVLDDASLEKAESEFRPLIERYSKSLLSGQWGSYPEEIITVALPSYAW